MLKGLKMMMMMMMRGEKLGLLVWLVVTGVLSAPGRAAEMPRIELSADGQRFELADSDTQFIPWGHNYASTDLLERLEADPQRVAREFQEMKAAGTTVARVHPELPRILTGPGQANPRAVSQLRQLLETAEQSGIYLKITGLAAYRIADRLEWYDTLPEAERWQTQAFFWETVAATCAQSPAVFAYDLVNEPAAVGKVEDGWYTGRMGDVEFCQRLSLTPGDRTAGDIFRDWTRQMVAAIDKHDPQRLITLGMLPFPTAYQSTVEHLDFVSPHLYPETGKVEQELELLKRFDWGKPIVIGETFPLKSGVADLRQFLLESRPWADGWLGHWPDTSPEVLAQRKAAGEATIHDAIWLSWVELFRELGPEMLQAK